MVYLRFWEQGQAGGWHCVSVAILLGKPAPHRPPLEPSSSLKLVQRGPPPLSPRSQDLFSAPGALPGTPCDPREGLVPRLLPERPQRAQGEAREENGVGGEREDVREPPRAHGRWGSLESTYGFCLHTCF